MKKFKETIIKPIQQINAESELIDRMYFTLHENDTQWLENLKKNNIRKGDLTRLNKLVNHLQEVGEELPNTYEEIQIYFKNLLDEEFAELSTIYSLVLQKQQQHLGELNMGAQHKYYFDYYSKRLEDLDKLMDVFKKVRSDVKTLFDDYTVKMGQAHETILKAIEFMDRYNNTIEEGEMVDELTALFGKL